MNFHSLIWQHFEHPHKVGYFDENALNIGTAKVGSISRGALLQLQIKVHAAQVIEDCCFKAYGNGVLIACCSYAMTQLPKLLLEDATRINHRLLINDLAVPENFIHSAILVEDGITMAIANYKAKSNTR